MKELTGGTCDNCGHVSWPEPKYCPQGCGRTISSVGLANEGAIYVSTVVNVPHPVYGLTYQVGYVDLSSGPRVFGHFNTTEPVSAGTSVKVDLVEFDVPDGADTKVNTVVFRVEE